MTSMKHFFIPHANITENNIEEYNKFTKIMESEDKLDKIYKEFFWSNKKDKKTIQEN